MKKKLFPIISILLFISLQSISAQNPYTYIQVKILETDTSNIQDRYHLFFRKQNDYERDRWDRTIGWKMKYYSERGFFEDGDLGQYCKELIEIKITHQSDTMIIRFKKEDLQNDEPCIGIAQFHLEVPFQKGYFEITDFVKTWGKGFTIEDNYQWIDLPIEERKLILPKE